MENLCRNKVQNLMFHHLEELYPDFDFKDGLEIENALFKDVADFQSTVALKYAKKLKKSPVDIAKSISLNIDDNMIEHCFATKPGFINFRLSDRFLLKVLISEKSPLFENNTREVVVDYSGPNAAKQMHVGHLRSTVIGDAIANLYEYVGWNVRRVNHLGDWGTQFGMIIESLIESKYLVDSLSIEFLENIYRVSKERFDSDYEFRNRSLKRVSLLQQGDAHTLDIWEIIRDISINSFLSVYEFLGVKLTRENIKGESFYNSFLESTIDELEQKKCVYSSDNSVALLAKVNLVGRETPFPFIVRKSDGAYLYSSTDLAALKYRIKNEHVSRVVYVTDSRQADHFSCVFSLATTAGWVRSEIDLYHCSFGMVTDKDGKPFKTRESDNVKLMSLLNEGVVRVKEIYNSRNSELKGELLDYTIKMLAVACIKYSDLSVDRQNNYAFDWDEFLSVEGNTAVYLYSGYTKTKLLLDKFDSDIEFYSFDNSKIKFSDIERRIILKIEEFSDVINNALIDHKPSYVCNYLYQLTKMIHSYYDSDRLSDVTDIDLKNMKISIYRKYSKVFKDCASILGLPILDRI